MSKTNYKNPLAREGFNPDDYKQYYSNGKAYLPFKIQLLWFRMVYPNGKLVVFRPDLAPMKENNTFVATARVYSDLNRNQDEYLAEASAMRGPEVKIEETGESIDPYNATQVAAMSLALKLAGFWCSIDEDDLTKELEQAVTGNEAEKKQEKETSEQTPKTDAKPGVNKGKRGRKKEEANSADKSEEVKQPNEQAAQDAPKEPVPETEKTEEKEPETQPEAEVNQNETPAKAEPATEETAEQNDVSAEDTNEAVEETSNEQVVEETENPQEETEENAGSDMAEAESEEADNKQEAPVEQEVAEQSAVEEAEAEVPDEEELAQLRQVMFENGYFNDTIGVLEDSAMKELEEGNNINDAFHLRLYRYLLTSPMAKGKNQQASAAALRLAELVHKDWLAEWLGTNNGRA